LSTKLYIINKICEIEQHGQKQKHESETKYFKMKTPFPFFALVVKSSFTKWIYCTNWIGGDQVLIWHI